MLRPRRRVAQAAILLTLAAAQAFLIACTNSQGAVPPPPSASPPTESAAAPNATPVAAAAAATQSPSPPTPTPTEPWIAGTPWPAPVNLPILMYHHVNSTPPATELEASLTVTDADFGRQLTYLKCAGFAAVTLSQLFDGIYKGAPLPKKPVLLTFDDGFADAFTNALPLLRQYGFGGSFLIVTSFVGQAGYVTWAQVQEMAGSGMEIVAHSVHHSNLATEPDDIVRIELGESKRVLEEKIGRPVEFFAYPAGEPFYRGTEERQRQIVQMVREAGYRGALAVENSLTQDPAMPYALSRLRVRGGVDLRRFAENMGAPLPETVGC